MKRISVEGFLFSLAMSVLIVGSIVLYGLLENKKRQSRTQPAGTVIISDAWGQYPDTARQIIKSTKYIERGGKFFARIDTLQDTSYKIKFITKKFPW